jgi:hypothetical protein
MSSSSLLLARRQAQALADRPRLVAHGPRLCSPTSYEYIGAHAEDGPILGALGGTLRVVHGSCQTLRHVATCKPFSNDEAAGT